MSLETVVTDIREEAEREAEEIIEAAEADAAEIIEDAERRAEALLEEAEAAVESEIDAEREQTLSNAKLEAKQEKLEARREVLDRVREQLEAAIENLPEEKRATLTGELLEAGAVEFEAADVYGRPEDESLLVDLLEDYDGLTYAGEQECLGGVVLKGRDGRLRVDNTFDSILETVWEEELKSFSDVVFEPQ